MTYTAGLTWMTMTITSASVAMMENIHVREVKSRFGKLLGCILTFCPVGKALKTALTSIIPCPLSHKINPVLPVTCKEVADAATKVRNDRVAVAVDMWTSSAEFAGKSYVANQADKSNDKAHPTAASQVNNLQKPTTYTNVLPNYHAFCIVCKRLFAFCTSNDWPTSRIARTTGPTWMTMTITSYRPINPKFLLKRYADPLCKLWRLSVK